MRLLRNSSYSKGHPTLWLLLLKVMMVLLIAAAIGIWLWYGHRIEALEGKLRY
jgi:membrane protein YdbS with pleckstrin-like domain